MPQRTRKPAAADVVEAAVRREAAQLVALDPLVRLRQDLPDGDTPVHQARVACRRLRSDLRTFRRLVCKQWGRDLRAELKWFAAALGAARDAEVLRARLGETARADPVADLTALEPAAIEVLDSALRERQRVALAELDAVLASERYAALLAALADATARVPVRGRARKPATRVLPRLVRGPWRALAEAAPALRPEAPDARWHEVRVLAKKARYAVEAVAQKSRPRRKLGKRLAALQDLLGEHQDAVVAAQTWLDLAEPVPVTAGRLAERERAAARRMRDAYARAWSACDRRKLTGWLD
jgi:CHAD domain-containing protein